MSQPGKAGGHQPPGGERWSCTTYTCRKKMSSWMSLEVMLSKKTSSKDKDRVTPSSPCLTSLWSRRDTGAP